MIDWRGGRSHAAQEEAEKAAFKSAIYAILWTGLPSALSYTECLCLSHFEGLAD